MCELQYVMKNIGHLLEQLYLYAKYCCKQNYSHYTTQFLKALFTYSKMLNFRNRINRFYVAIFLTVQKDLLNCINCIG